MLNHHHGFWGIRDLASANGFQADGEISNQIEPAIATPEDHPIPVEEGVFPDENILLFEVHRPSP
jgi:hypothetical protein